MKIPLHQNIMKTDTSNHDKFITPHHVMQCFDSVPGYLNLSLPTLGTLLKAWM